MGTQIGDTQVHEELHTERLYLHSKERDRIASISSTDRAGLLISLGDAQSLTTAEVEIAPEMHRWKLSFTHESGARFVVELDPSGANLNLSAGNRSAVATMSTWDLEGPGGSAFMSFHPGGDAVSGEACSIGVDSGNLSQVGPSAFLRLRRHLELEYEDTGETVKLWENILQVSGDERFLVSPWVEKPR